MNVLPYSLENLGCGSNERESTPPDQFQNSNDQTQSFFLAYPVSFTYHRRSSTILLKKYVGKTKFISFSYSLNILC